MGKYSPLREFLAKQGREFVPMSFEEIEHVLGESLPASKQYPAWWSNNPSNNVMTKEWIAAGYQTESVDIAGEKLVFRKVKKSSASFSASLSAPSANEVSQEKKVAGRLPFFGFMKGKMTIEPGYDITKPIDMEWENSYLGEDRIK
jgi:hypothetical protein